MWAGVAVSADAIPGEEYCDRTIDSIVFSGNKVTRRQVLLREIDQQINTPCSIDQIVDSTQGIMDLGLFKSVYAELALKDDGLQLQFTVKEKLYFLLLPRVSRTSDAEIRGGAQLRFDNFQGRMHEMRITSERRKENDGEGPGGYVHRLGYNVPRFFGSDYGFGFDLGSDRRQINLAVDGTELGQAQSQTQTIRLQFSRWLNQSRGVQGRRYFFGVQFATRKLDMLSGRPGPYRGGDDLSLTVGLEDKQVHQDAFRRRGTVVGASLTAANLSAGSDFEYTRADAYAKAYIPLANGIRNLNVQARLGISDGAAFGENSYGIGGGEKLRGLQPGSRSGDLMALVNVEYLHALFDHPQFRMAVFTDIGDVYKNRSVNLSKMQVRSGVGIRLKLLNFSNTDVRVDVAWDSDRERLQTYVSSNLTF